MAQAKPKKKQSRTRPLPLRAESILQAPVDQFAERAYLNYSMYVILDRALPHLSDGLKPVQRRIIYAMSELSLKFPNKPKKSARTVGDVIGKFHPHGDTACYEAMVLMAQPFTFRYPLIQGQGNWGSYDDPKSFAAMRYTESRLTPYCDALLTELTQGTVKWQPNFDGTLHEPQYFPARLPNILLNGTTGIAVGMSTDVPPHNLREVATACEALLKNSRLPDDEVIKLIHAPDYPTGGEIITPLTDIHQIYKEGSGTIKLRATYQKEKGRIIITSLPYRVSTHKVMTEILDEIKNNKHLPIKGIRDESDEEMPVRIVIVTKGRGADTEMLMSHLFAATSLEQTCRINLNIIDLDGKPKVMGVARILKQWVQYRTDIVKKRLQWREHKINERLEILQGLLVAHLNIDQVIKIIRNNDKPAPLLMKQFKLTEVQVHAILAIRLRQLGKLEEIEIKKENKALEEELAKIKLTLSSTQRLRTLIRKEIRKDAEEYGDDRRCQVATRPVAHAVKVRATEEIYPISVVLSQQSWVFALKKHEIDLDGIAYRTGDAFCSLAQGQSNQPAVFIDTEGRVYCLPASELPINANRSEPLSSRFKTTSEVGFVSVLMGDEKSKWMMASSAGYGFITRMEDLISRIRTGRQVIHTPEGSHSLPAARVPEGKGVQAIVITSAGYMLAISIDEITELSKGKGRKLINIPKQKDKGEAEYVRHIACLAPDEHIQLRAGQRKKKFSYNDIQHYRGTRGRRGRVLPPRWRDIHSVKIVPK